MKSSSDKNVFDQARRAVWRRKWLICAIFALVVAGGMTATMLITPKYEATMSILVSRDRVDPQISPAEKLPEMVRSDISDEEFNSELELIQSNEVIAGAVKDLDLVRDRAPRRETRLDDARQRVREFLSGLTRRTPSDPEKTSQATAESRAGDDFAVEKAVNRVSDNLDVVPTKKSRVIKITYADTDPLRAKKTLEKIYEKYVELHVQMNENPQAGQVFNQQSDSFNRKLSQSTSALKQFDERNGVTGADIRVQQELLLKQLYEAQAQSSAARTEIGETIERIASLKEKIAGQPVEIQTGSVSKYVSALDRMKEELIQLEQQRTQLLQKYQPASRPVRDNEERIERLKKSIVEETANPPQERSFALNDLRRRLESDLANAQTSLAALRERDKNLAAQTEKLRAEVAALNVRSIERSNLERARSVNEEAYLLYQKKARENEISRVLNREQVMNFKVVDAPRTDGEPKSPQPFLNFLVLVFVGLASGFAAALVLDKLSAANGGSNNSRETFDSDADLVLSPQGIERRWELPVLAVVPLIESETSEIKIVRREKNLGLLPAAAGEENGDYRPHRKNY